MMCHFTPHSRRHRVSALSCVVPIKRRLSFSPSLVALRVQDVGSSSGSSGSSSSAGVGREGKVNERNDGKVEQHSAL